MRRTFPILLAASALAAQQLTFEVASIKPNAANDHRVMIRMAPGGRFTATGVTLKQLMNQAYNVRDFQITNGPGWISSDAYDVNAKAADGAPDRITPDQLRPMLKALLAERFQLKVHTESKEMPVFALMVGKGGLKVKELPARPPQTEGGPPQPRGMMRMGRGQINAQGVTMTAFAQMLSQQLGRTVLDKTELKGEYDISLEFSPEPGQGGGPFGGPPPSPDSLPATGSSGPTIFTALQEQVGLKLDSAKGPVEIIVIDHVEKPSEN